MVVLQIVSGMVLGWGFMAIVKGEKGGFPIFLLGAVCTYATITLNKVW